MESGPLGWLVVLLGVIGGLLATQHAASAAPRAAVPSDSEVGASPFHGGRPFGLEQTQALRGGQPFGPEQTQAIRGGQPAGTGNPPVSKWPWIAMVRTRLEYTENGTDHIQDRLVCGGSLITSRHVLAAAHCYKQLLTGAIKRIPGKIYVRLGEFDTSTLSDGHATEYDVEAITFPRDYKVNDKYSDDIAVFRLAKEVQFSAGVCTIPLPDATTGDLAGRKLSMAGWGITQPWSEQPATVLQEVNATALSEDGCHKELAKHFNDVDKLFSGEIMQKRICMERQKKGQGPCESDSGSPVVEHGRFRLVGVIVSAFSGPHCSRDKVPVSIAMRVSAYLDFIQKTTNITGVKTSHCQNTFVEAG